MCEVVEDDEMVTTGFVGLTWGDHPVPRGCAEAMVAHCEANRVKTILETGSGISTVYLADYARRRGAYVMSLEHERRWYQQTWGWLRLNGLEREVDLVHAPLSPDGWYGVDLPRVRFDFVFVDGYGTTRAETLPRLLSAGLLDPGWELWMHDGNRLKEQEIARRWMDEYPVQGELRDIDDRGVWVIRPHPLAK